MGRRLVRPDKQCPNNCFCIWWFWSRTGRCPFQLWLGTL